MEKEASGDGSHVTEYLSASHFGLLCQWAGIRDEVAPWWGELVRQLEYKAAWYGATVVKASRFYPSSKTCSGCGTAKAKLSLAEREFHCITCGTRIGRDVNAAINLARLGDPGFLVESACYELDRCSDGSAFHREADPHRYGSSRAQQPCSGELGSARWTIHARLRPCVAA